MKPFGISVNKILYFFVYIYKMYIYKKLKPKMKKNGLLLSSFLIINNENNYNLEDKKKNWNKINKYDGKPHNVTSFFLRDPYHYDLNTIKEISNFCGWKLLDCKDYDHDLQKMLFFKLI